MKNLFISLLIFVFAISLASCSNTPKPDKLSISVKTNLNYLQENPQFVMYLNFKNMNSTEFWKSNISDSILNSEKTFGSLLNTFKQATGVSISTGLDELYYANSWEGENSIVLKGLFDKNKLSTFMASDSTFKSSVYADGTTVYSKTDNGLLFFFKDDYTICASNYLNQINEMMAVKDTTASRLRKNKPMMEAIEKIIYKDNIWMVSTERTFIRGVFQNFIESTNSIPGGTSGNLMLDSLKPQDSTAQKKNNANENLIADIDKIYKDAKSMSFSILMNKDLTFLIQTEFNEQQYADYFKSIVNGIISFSKINSSIQGNNKSSTDKILDNTTITSVDKAVLVEMKVNSDNIQAFRQNAVLSPK